MKNFLLLLLGKEMSKDFDDSIAGVFRSECYYDWLSLKVIDKPKDSSEKNPEVLLMASYSEEIKSRQEMMKNGLHTQQGIIAIPADDEDEASYNEFLDEINRASIVFISFISVPTWSREDSEEILKTNGMADKNSYTDYRPTVNEVIKAEISSLLYKSSMRLFHTFDHNDFVLICNGEKTTLKDYINTLSKIRFLLLSKKYPAVHDITTIYGYKSSRLEGDSASNSISAVVSICGKDIFPNDIESSFSVETVGRYDHLSGYSNITWQQLAELGKKLHSGGIITSRVHIGCEMPVGLKGKHDAEFPKQSASPLHKKFEDIHNDKNYSIQSKDLLKIYPNETEYVESIRLLLEEIRLSISTTLRRGFSKYNSVCYIESYLLFVKYIKEKILGVASDKIEEYTEKNGGTPAEVLVDISNAFYKCILTLDSSIMHSERRFIMSDPYQLTLFDVPPKLIAYYTAIASNMALTLNGTSKNKYVFLITPDIKKDIYVESITDNRDIDNEMNILVIHINERSIYNVTDTTRALAHEIAHHVGQNSQLRRKRADHIIKCYVALLIQKCLNPDLFSNYSNPKDVVDVIKNISEDIFDMVKSSEFFKDLHNYYYMDELMDRFNAFMISALNNQEIFSKIDKKLFGLISKCLDNGVLMSCVINSDHFFVGSEVNIDDILQQYIHRLILETSYTNLTLFVSNSEDVKNSIKYILYLFKEGYADVQMILLTEDSSLEINKAMHNYSNSLRQVSNSPDEMIRKCAVKNAFVDENNRNYDDVTELMQNRDILEQAFYIYVCQQATEYFAAIDELSRFKSHKGSYCETFDRSKTLLFKKCNADDIIRYIDNTITNYIERILDQKHFCY